MNDVVIEASQLRKAFKGQMALDGLDLRVPAGSIYGFLGRNGAGKTTTIKILMSLLKTDSGTARVLGSSTGNPDSAIEIRRRIGFVTEEKELYPYMTVEQIIRFTRSFFPNWRDDLAQRYLKMFDLPSDRNIPMLSKGARSKLMLLLAISRGAELLILDEPTEGVDPAASDDILRELVTSAASEGTTIFFSSHHLAEVEQIADSVCIVDRGRAIISGGLDDLKLRYQRFQVVFDGQVRIPDRWVDGVENVRQEGRMVTLLASRNIDAVVAQVQSLPNSSIERFPVTLKEIFLEYVRSN